MDLFLFTTFFPFKRSEPFLVNEFEFTKKNYDHIAVMALYGQQKDLVLAPGADITVLAPPLPGPSDKKKLLFRGIFNLAPFHLHLRDFFSQAVFLSPKKIYWFFVSCLVTRLALSSKSYKQLVKIINSSSNPVLYFYWGDNLCWLIPYLCRKITDKHVKIVIRFHRTDLYENLKSDYAPLRKKIFESAHLLIPISEDGKRYLENKYPAFANKIVLSRLGVFDHGLNKPGEGEAKHLVSVSAVTQVKRVRLIFEALQHTRSKIVWHHFGDGPLLAELKQLVTQKRENLAVILHGFTANKDIMEFYKAQPVHGFINISASEGLPVSIMEALSFGIPVIATDVGGTAELVDSTTGCLIDKDIDAVTLGSEIEGFLSISGEEKNALRKNARQRFETRVNAETNYRQFYDLLRQSRGDV